MKEKINPLEEAINNLISEIETGLLNDRINTTIPHICLDYQSRLSTYSSTAMGLIERLDTLEAEYLINNRINFKSDTQTKKGWDITPEGIRQNFWNNRIKRMKILIKNLEKLYYHGRDEQKQIQLK